MWLPAALLSWLVLTTTFGRYLADVSPGQALWVNPSSSAARLNLADEMVFGPIRRKSSVETQAAAVTPETGDPGARDLTVPLSRMATQVLEQSAAGRVPAESQSAGRGRRNASCGAVDA